MITILTILSFAIIIIASYYIGNRYMDSFDESIASQLFSSIVGLFILMCAFGIISLIALIYSCLEYFITDLLN